MSVKYTATWTCDGCKVKKVVHNDWMWPPYPWADVNYREENGSALVRRHYCAKCAKEKGL